jgi:hypothetical protein
MRAHTGDGLLAELQESRQYAGEPSNLPFAHSAACLSADAHAADARSAEQLLVRYDLDLNPNKQTNLDLEAHLVRQCRV